MLRRLAAWVKANVKYSLVLEKIAPLEKVLAELSASLDSSRERVRECERELEALDAEVVNLRVSLEDAQVRRRRSS